MKNICKKLYKGIIAFTILLSVVVNSFVYAENTDIDSSNYITNVDPFFSYWKNQFIIYVDNYSGNVDDVSIKDLNAGNGTSRVLVFSKLSESSYTYDDLLNDIKNTDTGTNLHDAFPILVHLPKSANSFESHAKLSSEDEKGKLMSGGPYSKYKDLTNGFYYKNKKQNKEEINKVLSDFHTYAKQISSHLNEIKSFSIKDLYPDANVALLTNGAANMAGTSTSKLYFLSLEKKYSPYRLSATDLQTGNILKGEATNNILDEWLPETLYIYDAYDKLIKKYPFETFQQILWSKQDLDVINWFKSLTK